MPLRIEAIPAFQTNYIWALIEGKDCLLVDPGSAAEPLDFLAREGLALRGLLLTHHHHDHIGGVDEILTRYPVPVWGPVDSRIAQVTHRVEHGDRFTTDSPTLDWRVIETPGHTTTHIVFVTDQLALVGDTLFSAGCGRLFEGTPEQMQHSLDRLAALPDDTVIYCAHEYTRDNCRFALAVEPDNPALKARAAQVDKLRQAGRITLPSTLGEEKTYNPFMRTREPAVIAAARERDPDCDRSPESVFGVLRRWKDNFG